VCGIFALAAMVFLLGMQCGIVLVRAFPIPVAGLPSETALAAEYDRGFADGSEAQSCPDEVAVYPPFYTDPQFGKAGETTDGTPYTVIWTTVEDGVEIEIPPPPGVDLNAPMPAPLPLPYGIVDDAIRKAAATLPLPEGTLK